jgi:hypothetical protein
MKRSLFLKIFGGYLILTIALSGLIVLISSYFVRSYQIERTARELKEIAIVLGERTPGMTSESGGAVIDRFVKEMGRRSTPAIPSLPLTAGASPIPRKTLPGWRTTA